MNKFHSRQQHAMIIKIYVQKTLMSVPMLPLTTVTLMLIVPTLLGASTVHVTKDTLEMD